MALTRFVPKLKLSRPRWSIGAKLVSLIAGLLLVSIAGVGLISTDRMVSNATDLVRDFTRTSASILASQVREGIVSATDKMRVLGGLIVQETIRPDVKNRLTAEFFAGDPDFLAIYVHALDEAGAPRPVAMAVSPELGRLGDADGTASWKITTEAKGFQLDALSRGEPQFASIRLPDRATSAIVIGVRFASSETTAPPRNPASDPRFVGPASPFASKKPTEPQTHMITAVLKQARIAEAFGKFDGASVFMVDRRARVLANGGIKRMATGESLTGSEIVKMLQEGKDVSGAKDNYIDPISGEQQIGAYALVGFAGLGVVAEIPSALVYAGTNQVKKLVGYGALIILFLAFWAGFLYSGTITRPIRRLVEAAGRIAQGDFAINLVAKGRDEIASLSTAFNDMAKGLEERDRVKETFNKFHNKEIAEKLLSGEVKLGGEKKTAVIFFSDVRGFTSMAEAMQPEQVVEMLNEYMTRMVKIIRQNGGVVDKYVGDAIMALWGVPIGGEHDAMSAVKACLEMRMELAHLNAIRIQRGQPVLRIGMGLNMGEVIAGNIGSEEKMEYTVIGDAVNLASRIEAMTKEFGTDLLISQGVSEKLGGKYLLETAGSANVKGKSSAIEVFKVSGYLDDQGKRMMLETPYSSYTPEKSDKVKAVAPVPVPEPTPAVPPPPGEAFEVKATAPLAPAPLPMPAEPPAVRRPPPPIARKPELVAEPLAQTIAIATPVAEIPPAPEHPPISDEPFLREENSLVMDLSKLTELSAADMKEFRGSGDAAEPSLTAQSVAAVEAPTSEEPTLTGLDLPTVAAPSVEAPSEEKEEITSFIQPAAPSDNPFKDDEPTRGFEIPAEAVAMAIIPVDEIRAEALAVETQTIPSIQSPLSPLDSQPERTIAIPTTFLTNPLAPLEAPAPTTMIPSLPSESANPISPLAPLSSEATTVAYTPPSSLFGDGLDSNWYVRIGGEILGPFSSDEIRQGLGRGELMPEYPMSSSSEGPWKRIDGYPQFAAKPDSQAA